LYRLVLFSSFLLNKKNLTVGASLAVFSLKNLGIICGKITSQLDLAVSLIYTTYGPIWA
jgi:hypothetical protein